LWWAAGKVNTINAGRLWVKSFQLCSTKHNKYIHVNGKERSRVTILNLERCKTTSDIVMWTRSKWSQTVILEYNTSLTKKLSYFYFRDIFGFCLLILTTFSLFRLEMISAHIDVIQWYFISNNHSSFSLYIAFRQSFYFFILLVFSKHFILVFIQFRCNHFCFYFI